LLWDAFLRNPRGWAGRAWERQIRPARSPFIGRLFEGSQDLRKHRPNGGRIGQSARLARNEQGMARPSSGIQDDQGVFETGPRLFGRNRQKPAKHLVMPERFGLQGGPKRRCSCSLLAGVPDRPTRRQHLPLEGGQRPGKLTRSIFRDELRHLLDPLAGEFQMKRTLLRRVAGERMLQPFKTNLEGVEPVPRDGPLRGFRNIEAQDHGEKERKGGRAQRSQSEDSPGRPSSGPPTLGGRPRERTYNRRRRVFSG
jgi:hypothetical protein